MRLTIRSKLMSVLFLVLLFAVVPTAWMGIRTFYQDKERTLQDLNAQTVSVQARALARQLRTQHRWLAMLTKTQADPQLRMLFERHFKEASWVGIFNLEKQQLSVKRLFYATNRKDAESPNDVAKDQGLVDTLRALKAGEMRLFPRQDKKGNPAVLFASRLSSYQVGMVLGPPETIFNLSTKAKAYSAFLIDYKGNVILHSEKAKMPKDVSYQDHRLVKILNTPGGLQVGGNARYLDPISQEEVFGAFAPLGVAKAGIIVQIPERTAFSAAAQMIKQFTFVALVIFSIAVTIGLLFASTITKPLAKIRSVTKQVGKGDFNIKLDRASNDELGDLTLAFNKMGSELIERDEKLKAAQQQLVQSEKMSAFGQMSAGIAHEVKNPLAGILGYAQLAKKKAEPESGAVRYLDIIEKETKRCKDIVENLMRFARQEKVEYTDFDVNQVVKDSVALVNHQVTISGVKIQQTYAEDGTLSPVSGNGNQLQQVLTNLMLNAQQAMKDRGTLSITTQKGANGWVEIKIGDTGEGIAQEHLKKIFEPFFTTKPAGKGTGLGLAVTYGIIQDHKGEIDVESEVGKGTIFTVRLPAKEGSASA